MVSSYAQPILFYHKVLNKVLESALKKKIRFDVALAHSLVSGDEAAMSVKFVIDRSSGQRITAT